MPPTLKELEYLTLQAGEILCAHFGQDLQVRYKGEIDLVTEADLRSEKYLLDEIRRRFPDDIIVSEESGSLPGALCCKWYIDPLDGTVNFAHGLPIFSVSVAYARDGELLLGSVYDPIRSELFSAQRGQGARCNGKTIHGSGQAELNRSLLVTGFAYDIRTNPYNNLGLFEKFSKLSQGVRRLGSAALDLCYVACGRLDGFWEIAIQPWDIAAGGLIASEAGVRVTQINGEADYLQTPCSILAAAPRLHALMLALIQERD
jgi:myo-inositol-1(or 4)-monophosphatase